MKNINLLPKKEKVRDVKGLILNIFMILAMIILICLVISVVFLMDLDKNLSAKLSEYESVNLIAQNYSNKLKVYKDFELKVNNKKVMIDNLKINKIFWSDIIYDIGSFVPERASIKSFEGQGSELYNYIKEYEKGEADEGKKIISFILQGEAEKYSEILKLLIELKKIDNLSDVWIESISETTVLETDIEASDFKINAYWELQPFLENVEVSKTGVNQDQEQELELEE